MSKVLLGENSTWAGPLPSSKESKEVSALSLDRIDDDVLPRDRGRESIKV